MLGSDFKQCTGGHFLSRSVGNLAKQLYRKALFSSRETKFEMADEMAVRRRLFRGVNPSVDAIPGVRN